MSIVLTWIAPFVIGLALTMVFYGFTRKRLANSFALAGAAFLAYCLVVVYYFGASILTETGPFDSSLDRLSFSFHMAALTLPLWAGLALLLTLRKEQP